jgi:hypothetical protein
VKPSFKTAHQMMTIKSTDDLSAKSTYALLNLLAKLSIKSAGRAGSGILFIEPLEAVLRVAVYDDKQLRLWPLTNI